MKKLLSAFIVIVSCISLSAQPTRIKGSVSTTDTADISIIDIYPESFPEVSLVFRAETRKGEPIWNLTREKMRVTENGRSCKVTSLEQISVNKPIALGVVIDHSASMGEFVQGETAPIDYAKKAVKSFVTSFNANKDLISIIGFTDSIDKRLPLTRDTVKINSIINSMEPELFTALYDAMIAGIEEVKDADNAIKVLVVLTDGRDNASSSTWRDVVGKAKKENIPVYIVGLGDVNRDSLQLIASSANGRFYFTESSASLETIYSEISKQVRAFYDLSYESKNFASADSTREIELSFDIDSVYLVSSPAKMILPEEVLAALRKKEKRRRYFLYGGIAVAVLVVAGLVLFRFDNKDERSVDKPIIKRLYPNPSNGLITIEFTGQPGQLKILGTNGEIIKVLEIAAPGQQFDLGSLPRGNYMAVVHSGGKQSNAVKFIIA